MFITSWPFPTGQPQTNDSSFKKPLNRSKIKLLFFSNSLTSPPCSLLAFFFFHENSVELYHNIHTHIPLYNKILKSHLQLVPTTANSESTTFLMFSSKSGIFASRKICLLLLLLVLHRQANWYHKATRSIQVSKINSEAWVLGPTHVDHVP